MAAMTTAMVGLMAVLLWTTGRLFKQRRLSDESVAWPQTRGEVLEARFSWSASPRSGTSYWPVVRYRYAVAGETFESDRVSFRAVYDRSDVEQAIHNYPVGAVVSVSFRPGDPAQAVLQPVSFNGQQRLRILVPLDIVALLFTVTCAGFLIFVSKPRS
jgi:Protein of unknown function (DUF3592)